ncbi:REP-associated tyrosine transposase [Pseudoxanthomonas putridarboris]|uniref:Transposase n=1 Tax=Pseudoxanthomonas putridarboris TaxID=752605 RepID=A0ABU9J0V1_9GAMM
MSYSSSRLRNGRCSQTGHAYLLTTCCHRRGRLLEHAGAAWTVLESAKWLDRERRWQLIAVVVMPDHVHLVGSLMDVPLTALMHSFKGHTAHAINALQGRSGRVWQAGYHDRSIRSDAAFRASIDYCLQNPVRAGLVEDFRDYPYWWCRWEV